jgi:hypothetical protein
MLYVSIFDAKKEVDMAEINREREEWYKKGREKTFRQMCKRLERYEIIGKFPLKIIFIIDTDEPHAINILTHHFGNAWESVTYPVFQREIYEAMEEDRTIIGG